MSSLASKLKTHITVRETSQEFVFRCRDVRSSLSTKVTAGRDLIPSPGSLDVIELSPDSDPKLILHKDNLGLLGLEDLNGDGTAEIIGCPCLSQTWGNGLETYDRLHVYVLSPLTGEAATLSLPLSKAYNLKHYYGWAGPDCREDVAVVLHPPGGGKAQIMKSADAERLTNGTKRK